MISRVVAKRVRIAWRVVAISDGSAYDDGKAYDNAQKCTRSKKGKEIQKTKSNK